MGHHCRYTEINLRRGCLSLVLLSEKEPRVCFLADKSRMTELPWSILFLPLNWILCRKARSPWGQLEACVEKLNITKVAFIEQLSTRILHNGCIEQRGFCGLQVCIMVCRKMTNMVCRSLYCQTAVKLRRSILTSTVLKEMFVESVYKKRRRRHMECVDHGILSFMQSVQKCFKSFGTSLVL